MYNIFCLLYTSLLFFIPKSPKLYSPDDIIGNWETVQNNLIVKVYKVGNEYKANVVWFKNSQERTKPSELWIDENNPNKDLRTRKVIGMEVLQHLIWNSNAQRWERGKIYDSTTGKEWNSTAWLSSKNLLNVRGFWHYEFLGKNLIFKKI